MGPPQAVLRMGLSVFNKILICFCLIQTGLASCIPAHKHSVDNYQPVIQVGVVVRMWCTVTWACTDQILSLLQKNHGGQHGNLTGCLVLSKSYLLPCQGRNCRYRYRIRYCGIKSQIVNVAATPAAERAPNWSSITFCPLIFILF